MNKLYCYTGTFNIVFLYDEELKISLCETAFKYLMDELETRTTIDEEDIKEVNSVDDVPSIYHEDAILIWGDDEERTVSQFLKTEKERELKEAQQLKKHQYKEYLRLKEIFEGSK